MLIMLKTNRIPPPAKKNNPVLKPTPAKDPGLPENKSNRRNLNERTKINATINILVKKKIYLLYLFNQILGSWLKKIRTRKRNATGEPSQDMTTTMSGSAQKAKANKRMSANKKDQFFD